MADHVSDPAAPVSDAPTEITIVQRVEQHLAAAAAPITALQMALAALVAEGRIRKDRGGYAITR